MATIKPVSPELADVQPYVQGVGKYLVDRLYGPHGPEWGTSFVDLEELAVQIGQAITHQMLQQSLQRQSAEPVPAADEVCPTCQRPGEGRDPQPRSVTTRAGDAQWDEPSRYCPRCRRAFFPSAKRLGIDLSSYSPAVLKQIIYAGVHHPSYEQASAALKHLAEQQVSAKQVERLTRRIGEERCDERDAAVRAYQALPLVQRKDIPTGATAPDLAVVQTDGGRLQILDRSAAGQEAAKSADGHWREDKVGLLATMTSVASASDPCPTIPETFVDPLRILKLTREIKGSAGVTEEEVTAESSAAAVAAATATAYLAPKLEQRSVVATRQDAYAFGEILSQSAWERGFYGATRRAFVADGSSTNWGIWERHFSNFEPIVDFVHAVTYVFSAAMAGRPFVEGWTAYTDWIGQMWVGKIEPVITALKQRQEVLGPAREDDADTSPRSLVARALEYLGNQKGRMQYAKYRQQGLPITSCHVESTIKQINRRVKGTEKFWSESGAEAILQLRADALSETEPLEAFWQRRQDNATGERRYSKAA